MTAAFRRLLLPAIALAALTGAPNPANATGPGPFGLWRNPAGDVEVAIEACGPQLCGTVAWAGPEAQNDAREAGVTQLVGTRLLRDYRPLSPDAWQGTVFVPDMGRSFFSRIQVLDADHLKISGCVMHGLICKSETWLRAPAQASGQASARGGAR